MPIKKEILYPIFLECVQYAEDIFWETIFEELAYGKTPCGCYINKEFLCCAYKGKEFSYKITRKHPEKIYTDIYNLLTEKLGILSQKEKVRKKIIFAEFEKTIKESRYEWTNIRKKSIKDVMYEKYVIDMQKKFSLNSLQTKYLLSLIIIAIMFKAITSKDIVFNGNKIENIKGITFETGKIIFTRSLAGNLCIDTESVQEAENRAIESDKIKPSILWEKFIKSLRKQRI